MKVLLSVFICGATLSAATLKKPDITATINQPDMSRTIVYSDHDIPMIHSRMNYTTLIVLPKEEKIMDISWGSKHDWTAQPPTGTNVAYIQSEKAGAKTNLNLVTASGNVYSFLIEEGGNPDLKVFVQAKDAAMKQAADAPPKWVQATELQVVKIEAEASKREAEASAAKARDEAKAANEQALKFGAEAQAKALAEIAEFRGQFPASLKHDYRYKNNRQFQVRAIAHNKDFTFLWASPQEVPALYEQKDGKPSLIQFSYAGGVYVVPKVLDSGYLVIGKHRLEFKRED
jgi:type IV secretion system protein VirB9